MPRPAKRYSLRNKRVTGTEIGDRKNKRNVLQPRARARASHDDKLVGPGNSPGGRSRMILPAGELGVGPGWAEIVIQVVHTLWISPGLLLSATVIFRSAFDTSSRTLYLIDEESCTSFG